MTFPASQLADMGDAGDYWVLTGLRVPLAGEGWSDAQVESRQIDYLVHVEGGPMTIYTNDEGVPAMGCCFHVPRFLRAAPDGSVWLTPGDGPEPLERAPWGCNGLARFDGTTWSRYLAGTCIYSLDVAPDGTAWAQGGTGDEPGAGADRDVRHPAVLRVARRQAHRRQLRAAPGRPRSLSP